MHNLLIRILVTGLFTFMLYGCAGTGILESRPGVGHGPPPHAPAHGYRHKHQQHGVEMVFNTGMGVYIVVGYPKHYFYSNSYYRYHDGIWKMSVHIKGPWVIITESDLPLGLRKMKDKGSKDKKHPGKGYGPPGRSK